MKRILLFTLLLASFGCVGPKVTVDYMRVSVPEEGGINFTQFTREDEKVVGPYIGVNEVTGKLVWYAPPFIAISPNGEKLAYIARSNEYNNLYIKNIAGGRATVQRTFNRNIMDMNYSPDGKHIVFTELRPATKQDLFMINATEGASVQQITASGSNELGPFFEASGESIFFSKEEGNRYYIWNVNLNSSLLTQYSEGFTPVLTPDGKDLIVTRNSKDGFRGEIWMINLQRGTETLILNDPEKGFSSPAISPDGKTIVFVGVSSKTDTKPQNLDLYSIRRDGTGLKQLTFHGGNDVSPQWAPDGTSLFFISQRGNEKGDFNVWRMNYNFN